MKKSSLIVVILLVVASVGMTVIFSNQVSIKGFLSSVYSTASGRNHIQLANAQSLGQGVVVFKAQFGHLEATGQVVSGISGLAGLPVTKFVPDRDLSDSEKKQVEVNITEENTVFGFIVAKNVSLGQGIGFNIPQGEVYNYGFYVNSDILPQGWTYNSSCVETGGNIKLSAGQQSECTIGFYLKPTPAPVTPPASTSTPVSPQEGASGTVISEDSGSGSLQFVKNILDLSTGWKNPGSDKILDAKIVELYGKKFLIVSTQNKHLLVYDASNQFSPVLLKDNDLSGSNVSAFYLVVLDNFNYVFAWGGNSANYGSFKIEQDGSASLVKSYKPDQYSVTQPNLVFGLFRGLDGKAYGFGGNGGDGWLTIYDVSDPANISEIGSYQDGLVGNHCGNYGLIGLDRPLQWNTSQQGNKLYLVTHADQCVQRLHTSGDARIYIFDVSDPKNPQLSHQYELSGSFNHIPSDATKAEQTFLFGGIADIAVDSNSGKVFDFYRTVFDWQGPSWSQIANIVHGTLFRYRTGLVTLSLQSDGSLKELSRALLCEQKGPMYDGGGPQYYRCGDVDGNDKNTQGGYDYSARNSQQNYNGVFLLSGPGNSGQVGLLRSDNSFVVIPDTAGEMTKFKTAIKDSSYYSNIYNPAINGVVTQVDSKTFAIYQFDSYSLSVVKVLLSQSLVGGSKNPSPPVTGVAPSANVPLTSPAFSFNALLNIFRRILNNY